MLKKFTPPQWGPYGKKYAGISKITQVEGCPTARLDFCTAPAVMGFDLRVPNVTIPSAYHPWEASADLGFFAFRHELEWKDRVYADVSYTVLSDNSVLIRTEIINNSEYDKNCVINLFYSLELPSGRTFSPSLPEKCEFIDACGFVEYEYAVPRPWDNQNADGRKKGIFPDSRFSSARGLGDRAEKWHLPNKVFKPFGGEKGDKVKYAFSPADEYENPLLVVRYRSVALEYTGAAVDGVFFKKSSDTAAFSVNGVRLELPPSDELAFAAIPLERVDGELELVSFGEGGVEFDFFVICEADDADIITSGNKNDCETQLYSPLTEVKDFDTGVLFKSSYKGCPDRVFLRVFDGKTRPRHIETGCLEDCLSSRLSNADPTFDDVLASFTGAFSRKHSDDGHFENAIVPEIIVPSGGKAVRYAVVSDVPGFSVHPDEFEGLYLAGKKKAIALDLSPNGEKYALSNRLLIAAMLTNVVYPIYKDEKYIVHFTPGKRWDCLYTWDSGFIGLGMNELSPKISAYILDLYLSDESNSHYAFLHHGSPVPTQMYQFLEMLQNAKDKSDILELYPRLKLYYDFILGRTHGSTTAKFKSGLLTTYDYFYSSSGMDDYPAQVAMMNENRRDKASPVITTATAIRFAKTLKTAATLLDLGKDVERFEADIERLFAALDNYAWDDDAGYYSYVLHDEDHNPMGIYKTPAGENLNKGLDGVYPLVAGMKSGERRERLLAHLKNSNEMLSPYGISAVDQSASYFRQDGYWNGHIWFPHQWILWKSMLDMNEGDFAFEIARRALDIWKREVDSTYYTFEMVSVKTGIGGWFHNFGGLSSPIILWAKAYYSPGAVNLGFDALCISKTFGEDFSSLELTVDYQGSEDSFTLLAAMKPGGNYRATAGGCPVPVRMRSDCCAEIVVPAGKNIKISISEG